MNLTRRMTGVLALLVLPLAIVSAGPDLRPASVKSVTYATVPDAIGADGFVVFGVEFNSRGKIVEVDTLRDAGGLAKTARASVRTWEFSPAILDGNRVASMMTVAFVYRPGNLLYLAPKPWPDFSYPPSPPDPQDVEKSVYTPPRILAVAYPQYPAKGIQGASVIVQLSLDTAGVVTDAQVLHDMGAFTKLSLDAVPFWKFEPAKLRGVAVASKVVIAFVFQAPPSATF